MNDEFKNRSAEIRKLLEKQTDIIEQIENEDHINKETENTINNLLNDQRNLREKIEKNRKRQKGIFDRALRYKQTRTNQKWQSQLKQGKKEFEAALSDKQPSSDLILALNCYIKKETKRKY